MDLNESYQAMNHNSQNAYMGNYKVNEKKIRQAPYFYENCNVLQRLIGVKIASAYRQSDSQTDDVFHDYLPIILETDTGKQIIIDVDEGMSNIMLDDTFGDKEAVTRILSRYKEISRIQIVKEYKSTLLPDIDFTRPIKGIKIISKKHEFSGWYEMSGVEITLESDDAFIIGTTLTDLHIQGVWILRAKDLHSDWERNSLPSSL